MAAPKKPREPNRAWLRLVLRVPPVGPPAPVPTEQSDPLPILFI